MSSPDPEAAFASLESAARAALDRPERLSPALSAKTLFTLWSSPGFGPHRAWSLLESPDGSLIIREAVWDRVSDLAAFAEPFPGHEIPRPSVPTLALQDARLPRAALVTLLATAAALTLTSDPPPVSPEIGHSSSVRFDSRPGAPRLHWGWDPPAGCEEIVAWFVEMRTALEAAIVAAEKS